MATTKEQISRWFDEGVRDGAAYMLVVVDTFDYEDYPVYCDTAEQAIEQYERHNQNMQRVMEVYDLKRMNKEDQLAEYRAFHLPKVPNGQA